MGSVYEDIDYKNNIFEYPDLTGIIGEPVTASLITLHNKVKSNAQAVNTSLGGGENGHLGLVCLRRHLRYFGSRKHTIWMAH